MNSEFKSCPHCAELVQPEAILCRFCDRGISKNHFKNCPRCSEMIWTGAVFCRYCKSGFQGVNDWDIFGSRTKADQQSAKTQAAKIKLGGQMLDDEAIEKIFSKRMKQEK